MNAAAPTLSVITPSYNQAAFIETTLRSVLSQGYPALEYIVVEDGSTDGTSAVLARYKDAITRIITGPNRGFGEALNSGLSECSGEIMAWINADDFYLPGAFDTVARVFSDCPEVDWVVGASLITDRAGHAVTINASVGFAKRLFFSGRYLGGYRGWSGAWIPQESVFWRRSLWDKAGAKFLREREQYGDFELWARFWQHSELHTLPVPLAAYRRHSETYTARRGRDSIKPCLQIIAESGFAKYGPQQMQWRGALCRMGNRLAKLFGEPAKILEFDHGENRWFVKTRYVM